MVLKNIFKRNPERHILLILDLPLFGLHYSLAIQLSNLMCNELIESLEPALQQKGARIE